MVRFTTSQVLCSRANIMLSVPGRETANTKKLGQKKPQQKTRGGSTLSTPGATDFHHTKWNHLEEFRGLHDWASMALVESHTAVCCVLRPHPDNVPATLVLFVTAAPKKHASDTAVCCVSQPHSDNMPEWTKGYFVIKHRLKRRVGQISDSIFLTKPEVDFQN